MTGKKNYDGTIKSPEKEYDLWTETKYFFKQGTPMALSSIFTYGVPPLFTVFLAGHTTNSALLQSTMGYGRLYIMVCSYIFIVGTGQYITAQVSAAYGANRLDRISTFLRTSFLLTMIMFIPISLLLYFSYPILIALNTDPEIAEQTAIYNRWMILNSFFLAILLQLQRILKCLKYNQFCMVISFLCGCFIDMVLCYILIYKLEYGIVGVAMTQILKNLATVLLYLAGISYYGLWTTFFGRTTNRILLPREEVRTFVSISGPTIGRFFGSWFIFEIQMLVLGEISGITKPAVAASAIWLQSSGALCTVNNSCDEVNVIRAMFHLGRGDGAFARKSFAFLLVLASAVVGIVNIALFLAQDSISTGLSNDKEVQQWLIGIIWLLFVGLQFRVVANTCANTMQSVNHGVAAVAFTFFSAYAIALPICTTIAWGHWVKADLLTRLLFALGIQTITSLCVSVLDGGYLWRTDWSLLAEEVQARAKGKSKSIETEPLLINDKEDP